MISWSLNDTTGRLSARDAADIVGAIDLLANANARWGLEPTQGSFGKGEHVVISLVDPGVTTEDVRDVEIPFAKDAPIRQASGIYESLATTISRALWERIREENPQQLIEETPHHAGCVRVPAPMARRPYTHQDLLELADPRGVFVEASPQEQEQELPPVLAIAISASTPDSEPEAPPEAPPPAPLDVDVLTEASTLEEETSPQEELEEAQAVEEAKSEIDVDIIES